MPIFVQDNKAKEDIKEEGENSLERAILLGKNMLFSWKSKCTAEKQARFEYIRCHLP